MFIELTEVLRCPNDHAEAYVVCVPVVMDGRRVLRGAIGCPVCNAEFLIEDGIAHFGAPPHPAPRTPYPDYDAAALAAFIDLQGRGGYVVLAGSAARHATPLAAAVPGVHVCAVNPPAGVAADTAISVVHAARGLPVKARSVRAVVLGADVAGEPWLEGGVRALLPGLRLVVEDEAAQPDGIAVLASAGGMMVGEKR